MSLLKVYHRCTQRFQPVLRMFEHWRWNLQLQPSKATHMDQHPFRQQCVCGFEFQVGIFFVSLESLLSSLRFSFHNLRTRSLHRIRSLQYTLFRTRWDISGVRNTIFGAHNGPFNLAKVPVFKWPKMGLRMAESENGDHFFMPQNGEIDIVLCVYQFWVGFWLIFGCFLPFFLEHGHKTKSVVLQQMCLDKKLKKTNKQTKF